MGAHSCEVHVNWAPLSDDRSIGIPKWAIQWDMRRLGTGGAGDVIAGNGFWPTGETIQVGETGEVGP